MDEKWICLAITIDAPSDEDAEQYAPNFALEQNIYAILYAYGVATVSVQDAQTLESASVAQGKKRLKAFFGEDGLLLVQEIKAVVEQEGRIFGLPVELSLSVFEDNAWKDSWKSWFKPAQVSPRVAIRAPWVDFEAAPGSHTIVIEPGMAFGTGLHETTQLCIRAIDEWSARREFGSMLDVGSGSGVLAIAAAKCGVKRVVGFDNDPVAVEVSVENAQINGVECEFSVEDPAQHGGRYDFVAANILSSVLVSLRAEMSRLCAPGGVLVLSGILSVEGEEVVEAYAEDDLGFRFLERHDLGEWCSLTFERVAN